MTYQDGLSDGIPGCLPHPRGFVHPPAENRVVTEDLAMGTVLRVTKADDQFQSGPYLRGWHDEAPRLTGSGVTPGRDIRRMHAIDELRCFPLPRPGHDFRMNYLKEVRC